MKGPLSRTVPCSHGTGRSSRGFCLSPGFELEAACPLMARLLNYFSGFVGVWPFMLQVSH